MNKQSSTDVSWWTQQPLWPLWPTSEVYCLTFMTYKYTESNKVKLYHPVSSFCLVPRPTSLVVSCLVVLCLMRWRNLSVLVSVQPRVLSPSPPILSSVLPTSQPLCCNCLPQQSHAMHYYRHTTVILVLTLCLHDKYDIFYLQSFNPLPSRRPCALSNTSFRMPPGTQLNPIARLGKYKLLQVRVHTGVLHFNNLLGLFRTGLV